MVVTVRGVRVRELTRSNMRAAWWTWRAVREARIELRRDGVRARVDRSPDLPASARVGVNAVLRRLDPTCLERSIVLQQWLADHGSAPDIVVGVPRGGDDAGVDARGRVGFVAHAWLENETTADLKRRYQEIHRISRT